MRWLVRRREAGEEILRVLASSSHESIEPKQKRLLDRAACSWYDDQTHLTNFLPVSIAQVIGAANNLPQIIVALWVKKEVVYANN
jgi:hypothetical protein